MRLRTLSPGEMNADQTSIFDESAAGKRGVVTPPARAWIHAPEVARHANRLRRREDELETRGFVFGRLPGAERDVEPGLAIGSGLDHEDLLHREGLVEGELLVALVAGRAQRTWVAVR